MAQKTQLALDAKQPIAIENTRAEFDALTVFNAGDVHNVEEANGTITQYIVGTDAVPRAEDRGVSFSFAQALSQTQQERARDNANSEVKSKLVSRAQFDAMTTFIPFDRFDILELDGTFSQSVVDAGGNALPVKLLANGLLNVVHTGIPNDGTNDPADIKALIDCLLYTSPSPRDKRQSRMPSSA